MSTIFKMLLAKMANNEVLKVTFNEKRTNHTVLLPSSKACLANKLLIYWFEKNASVKSVFFYFDWPWHFISSRFTSMMMNVAQQCLKSLQASVIFIFYAHTISRLESLLKGKEILMIIDKILSAAWTSSSETQVCCAQLFSTIFSMNGEGGHFFGHMERIRKCGHTRH